MHMCNPPPPPHPRRELCPEHQAAARPCPSGSVHARPSLHSYFINIVRLRVAGCLVCALARERGRSYSRGCPARSASASRTAQPWVFGVMRLRR